MRSNLGIKIWDYRWFAFTSFAFLFRKKKYFKEKKQCSDVSPGVGMRQLESPKNPDGLNLDIHIFVYVYKVHMCIHMLRGGMRSWTNLCSVCVCVRVHTLSHTYTPTLVKNREDTDNTTIFPSVQNSPPHQATSALID